MSDAESRLYKEHPQADLTLISSDGVAFKARKLSLQASSDMFDAMTDFGAAAIKEGDQEDASQLKIPASAQILDMALACMHNQDVPLKPYRPQLLNDLYILGASWSSNSVLSLVRVLYGLCTDKPDRSTWDLGCRHHDEILLRAALPFMLGSKDIVGEKHSAANAMINAPERLREAFGSLAALLLYSAKHNAAATASDWALVRTLLKVVRASSGHKDCDLVTHAGLAVADAIDSRDSPREATMHALERLEGRYHKGGNSYLFECNMRCLQLYVKDPLRTALALDKVAR